MTEALCGMGRWKVEKLEDSAVSLLSYFMKYLAFLGTSRWSRFAIQELTPHIRQNRPGLVRLEAFGFDLTYHSPLAVLDLATTCPGIKVFLENDPRFVIFDNSFGSLLPSQRTRFYQIAQEIAEEMEAVYKIKVQEGPLTLTFPREFYCEDYTTSQVRIFDFS